MRAHRPVGRTRRSPVIPRLVGNHPGDCSTILYYRVIYVVLHRKVYRVRGVWPLERINLY